MADETDAFPRLGGEINAVKRADGAEMFFDAAQPGDDLRAGLSHRQRCSARGEGAGAKAPGDHFILALIVAIASACVYS